MWNQSIEAVITNEHLRYQLRGISLVLIASQEYMPDFIYWMEYAKVNNN